MKIFRLVANTVMVFVSLGLIIAIVFFKQNSPRQQAEFFYGLQKYFSGGSTEEIWLLNKAIELDSTFALAYRELSIQYNYKGLYEEGMRLLDKAVALDPVNQLGYRGHVKLFVVNDYLGAIEDFSALDSLTPEFRDAPWGDDIYYVMGLAYHGLGNRIAAEKYYSRSIDMTSMERSEEWVNTEIYLARGVLLFEQEKYEAAMEDFDRAIKYFPRYTEAYYWKGKTHYQLADLDLSLSALRSAQEHLDNGMIEGHHYYDLPFQLYPEDIQEATREVAQLALLR